MRNHVSIGCTRGRSSEGRPSSTMAAEPYRGSHHCQSEWQLVGKAARAVRFCTPVGRRLAQDGRDYAKRFLERLRRER